MERKGAGGYLRLGSIDEARRRNPSRSERRKTVLLEENKVINRLRRALVVAVNLDPVSGHEQAGYRPAIILSDPNMASEMRYPLVAVVPVTRTELSGTFCIRLPSGSGGLKSDSFALVDQLRSIDIRRISKTFGVIPENTVARIDASIKIFLGLK